MATEHVTVYWVHETERNAVMPLLSSVVSQTDSFAVGDIDEADIPKAEAAGAIVQEQRAAPNRAAPPKLRMRSNAFGFAVAAVAPSAGDDGVPAEVDYYTVDLSVPLVDAVRAALENAGATLMEVLPDGGYKIRARSEAIPAIRAVAGVVNVAWIPPSASAPHIATLAAAPAGAEQQPAKMLTFDARLHDPNDLAAIVQWLGQQHVAIAGSSGRKVRFYAVPDAPVLDDLARRPEVDVVAQYILPKTFAEFARKVLGADAVAAPAAAPAIALDGDGEIIAIADTGIDATHPDFAGRILSAIPRGRAGDASDPDGHGTHVAGCAAGDGTASSGRIKGVAPKAKLVVQSLLGPAGDLSGIPLDLNDLFLEAYNAGARIHNASWGTAGRVGLRDQQRRGRRVRVQPSRHAGGDRGGERRHRRVAGQERGGFRRLALDREPGVEQERDHRRREPQQPHRRPVRRADVGRRVSLGISGAADRERARVRRSRFARRVQQPRPVR